jgi:hypothetical protein
MLFATFLLLAPDVSGQGLMDGIMGEQSTGIFGSGKASAAPGFSLEGIVGMLGPVLGMTPDTSGGSGPYKSSYSAVPDLAKHTLYQPKSPPAGQKLPVIVWGEWTSYISLKDFDFTERDQETEHVQVVEPGFRSS